MTTIIGVQYDDKALLIADSRVTDDSGRIFSHPKMQKMVEHHGYVIAGAGEVAPCDIAMHVWIPPKPTSKERENLYQFMIKKVMPSLRKCLTDNGYNFDEPHDRAKDGLRFQLLISVGGEIFDISDDLSVCITEEGIYGIGSGSAFALGALHVGAKPLKAMEAAAKLSAFTSAPFQTIEQFK
jgi:ATP-dependent protease HslVU (ClpYQ) peptidase subunit